MLQSHKAPCVRACCWGGGGGYTTTATSTSGTVLATDFEVYINAALY